MIIARSPLRISFVGGGTDLPEFCNENQGATLSCTINKYIYVIINRGFKDRIRVSYTSLEDVEEVEKLKHDLVREVIKLMFPDGKIPGIEIHTISDLPTRGSGLGSSATLTVGLIVGLSELFGHETKWPGIIHDKRKLVDLAYKVERVLLGRKVGKQDQAACAYGGINMFRFFSNGVFTAQKMPHVDLYDLSRYCLLVPTNIERDANVVLTDQVYSIDAIRDRYIAMEALARKAHEKSFGGNFPKMIAGYVRDSYEIKRTLSTKIEPEKVKRMINFVRESGSYGEKLLGAGGGGHILVMCNPTQKGRLANEIKKEFGISPIDFIFNDEATKIIARA